MQTLTEREVAELLRCSVAALRRWRREHRGPHFVKLERLIRYPVSDLREFLDQNTIGSTPQTSAPGGSK